MRITAIRAWQVDLPLKEGRYTWSDGHYVEVFDSTIVGIETDTGITGWAECCPLGPVYLPAYAEGVRAGIRQIGPSLIGADPRALTDINIRMDRALNGHPYAKSPLDIACWDILGKATDLPLCLLLGGSQQPSVPLYRAISQDSPQAMASRIEGYAAEGYTKFQLKVGGEAETDIARIHATRAALSPDHILIADANTGWTRAEAARVAAATADLDIYLEQPCATYSECLSVRRRWPRAFVLDEIIDTSDKLTRALAEDAMDIINLKISRVGGLTRARLIRDLCITAGIPMTVEDTWGGDIATAAIAHLAQSTPAAFCFSSTDFNSYVTTEVATGAPGRKAGAMSAALDRPGLGVTPKMEVLGDPVLEVTA